MEHTDLSCFTIAALAERGIERQHTSLEKTALAAQDLAKAYLIIALCEVEHRPLIEQTHPLWVDHAIYWNVPDLAHWPPDQALSEIESQVLLLLNLLTGRQLSATQTFGDLVEHADGFVATR